MNTGIDFRFKATRS